ncbi:hypothetical protein [Enterobacter roggenkampii]|uniref:hypothetical protein n=1 Tax=Enterobacter roggenkampii TaxID=1812935 RepID=UPI002075100C|nr:hypothetical protein [Enterobacter roggenkampii]MCM6993441.1 hypothetical protein [Enterobacter roggenkampii]
MDSQAYRVAVLLTINDQLSKNLAKVGRDAKELGGKFDAINKSILAITKSSEAASKALEKLNRSLNSPASSQALGAKAYADSMERAAKAAKQIASNAPASNAMIGGLVGIAATSSIAARTSAANMLTSSGGGRMLPPAGGALLLTGPGGGSSWNGWKNGVPPGGWGPGGGGGGGGGGNGPGNGRTGGGGSRQYGMENLAIAYGGFEALKAISDKGIEYERELARLRQMGLDKSQINSSVEFVKNTKLPYTSQLDMMRIYTDAQGSFRQSGMSGNEALKSAMTMAPLLATYEAAMGALGGETKAATSQNMRNLNKIVEIMGGLQDTGKASNIVDAVFKASQASGRLVDENQLKQFVAYGSSATNHQSIKTIFAGLEPIIAEMGGSTTAVGMRTAYTRMNGMMSMPPKLLQHEMQRLGIADSTGRKQKEEFYNLQATDAIAYAKKMMEVYKLHGITKQTDIERENSILLGTNGAKIYNRIMAQMSTLLESEEAYDRSKGSGDVVNNPLNKQLMAQQKLAAKWADLELVLAKDGGALDLFTSGLSKLADIMEGLSKFGAANQKISSAVVNVLALVTSIAALKGGVWLLKHAVSVLFSPLELITGTKGLPLLTSSLGGLYGIVARLVPLLGLFIPTNNTPTTTEELKTIQSKGAENWSKENPGKPFAGTWQTQVMEWMDKHPGEPLSNYKGSQGGNVYPEVRTGGNNPKVEVHNYIDNKEITNGVVKTITKQASRAPTGPSGVDPSMNLIHPGMGSLVPR